MPNLVLTNFARLLAAKNITFSKVPIFVIHENILILQFQTFSQEELDELENYIIDEDKNRKHTFSEVNGISEKYRGFNFKPTLLSLKTLYLNFFNS